MGLSTAFEDAILPIFVEMGKCLFYLSVMSGIYVLIRGNASESIKKIKMSIIGYTALTLIKQFVNLIDKLAANIHF